MWIYKDNIVKDLIEGFESFVYIIKRTNIKEDTSRPIYYIGKKNFYSRRKIKNKIIISESNWQEYYGSSENLNKDIEKYGKENFSRHILHFCRTKGDSGYLEIKEQIERNVLYVNKDNYKLYYNNNIDGRFHSHPDGFELATNLDLYFSNEYEKDKKWVTNNKDNRLLSVKEANKIVGTKNWVFGRTLFEDNYKNKNKILYNIEVNNNKISIFKDGLYKHILIKDLDNYKDWNIENEYKQTIKYWVTNNIEEKYFINEIDKKNYLKTNKYWVDGRISNDNDNIFAIDMELDIKVCVTKNEFNINNNLIPINSKKIKVKSKNRIIFSGYLDKFLQETNIPKTLVLKSLKNNGEVIVVNKGKNIILNDKKYSIKYI